MNSPALSLSYLVRNPYSYCFRIRVPLDLQVCLAKKELRYSLKTGYLAEAKRKARLMAGMIQTLFARLRELHKMKLTDDQIQKIATDYLQQLVETFTAPPPPLDPDMNPLIAAIALKKKLESMSCDKWQIVIDMETGRYNEVIRKLPKILDAHGIEFEDLDRNDSSFINLCQAVMRAQHRAIEHYEAKVEGRAPRDELDLAMDAVIGSDLGQNHPAIDETPADSLEIVLDSYWKRRKGGWGAAALESYERYKSRLLDHFGKDRPINAITYKDMEAFRDELQSSGNKGKPVSVKTVNLHLEFYSGVFNHAVQSGRINHSPVNGLKLSDKRNQQELNDPFTRDDLVKLFHCDEYRNDLFDAGWKFWVPPLLLYTGARLEEICQLYVDDIKTIDGIWVLDIDATRPDQKVKTHEKRYIPLHPFLTEDLGFIEYAHRLPDQDGRLFPELIPIGQRKRYGHYLSSNWFPMFKKKCGLRAPKGKKTIHSFRHSVASRLMEQDVQEYVIAMMLGHKHPQISTGRYGKKYEPATLMEKAVLKLDYPVDMNHLKSSKWVPAAGQKERE